MRPIGTKVYLISCVSQKRDQPCPACDLYVSDLFRKSRRYAEASGCPWFILSAEYGLIPPNRLVAPYERTLNRMAATERRRWAERVTDQLTTAVPDLGTVVFLAGKRYREFVISRLAEQHVAVLIPMQGLRIGEQLRWLAQHTRSHAGEKSII
ncbi:MAG TPA: hypothetical protein VG826_11875 [Pirellulales bacterium]|nr:hypothetical protein [Pirellulales bacterium]